MSDSEVPISVDATGLISVISTVPTDTAYVIRINFTALYHWGAGGTFTSELMFGNCATIYTETLPLSSAMIYVMN